MLGKGGSVFSKLSVNPLGGHEVLLDDGTGKLLKESNLRLALDEEDAEDEDAGASLTLRGVPGSTKSLSQKSR